jgi:hypothetical protein
MLLLPAEFIVQHLLDSMEKRVVEREICREYSPATLVVRESYEGGS